MGMIWGLMGIAASFLENLSVSVEKKTLLKEHAMEFSASLVIFAMLFTTPLWFFSNPEAVSLGSVGMICVAGLLLALSTLFFAKALRHMATPYTNPFLALVPILVALFADAFVDESLTLFQWLAVFIISAGVYLLYAYEHKHIFDPIIKAIHIPHLKYVLMAIILYSFGAVLDKKIIKFYHVAVWSYLPMLFFFAGVFLIIIMIMFHDGFHGIGNGMRNNTRSLSILALLMVLSKGALVFALTLPGVLVSVLYSVKQVALLFSAAASGDLLHKDHVLRKMLACLLIIAGAALLVF
jgi:drug/metabolite transporter (DMT)-like permease